MNSNGHFVVPSEPKQQLDIVKKADGFIITIKGLNNNSFGL